jgi:hypothetical protein
VYDDGLKWWVTTPAKHHEFTSKKIFACKDKDCVKDVIGSLQKGGFLEASHRIFLYLRSGREEPLICDLLHIDASIPRYIYYGKTDGICRTAYISELTA